MLSLTKFSTLALAAFVSISIGSPLDPRVLEEGWTLLGYRTVNKAEAASINKESTLVYNLAFDNGQELGNGKSLSGSAGQWNVGKDLWYCYIIMHTQTLHSLKKVWIPQTHWFNPESSIEQYVTSKGLHASETLRFAQVLGKSFNELFIPSAMVKADEHNIFAECYASLAELHAGMTRGNMVTPGSTVDYTTATFAGPKPAS